MLFDYYNHCCNYVCMTLAKNVRERREALNWTQDELAARAGISQQQIAAIENLKRNTKSSIYTPQIAAAFGISVDELLGIKKSEEAGGDYVHGTDIVKVTGALMNVSKDGRDRILKAVDRALKEFPRFSSSENQEDARNS